MEASGQLNTPAALSSGKGPRYPEDIKVGPRTGLDVVEKREIFFCCLNGFVESMAFA
jgi:hypothetical protein